MQEIIQIMANLQAASRPPAFNNLSIKAPDFFDGTQPFIARSPIQNCKHIFHNDEEDFSEDKKKVLYATSFLIGRAEKWIEPHIPNLINKDSRDPLNNWELFESQLFALSGDPNEVRKAEAELDS
ncbi:hypothetical protein O181_017579 [Austropuccinia psidii MF-1]|uniref:DUF4939 domain-containing protein n=1 Tax=Austropuccinia psidii MF-1 TaxID=1389203 RepID=A0A9Q3GSX0_9BASI|nr:hypothetical protein [Austropuccinia psidii MF-1]